MADRGEAQRLLGVPFLPPAPMTSAVNAVRRGLGWARRAPAPGPVRVLEGLFGLIDNRVLGLLVELGVPDHLDRPRTTEELAAATGADVDGLGRLLRYAAGRGFVGCDRQGRWTGNAVSAVLRRDDPAGWRAWVEFAGSDWFWDSWRRLDAPVRGTSSAIEAAVGQDFFSWATQVRPDAGDVFDRAMAAGATVQAFALSEVLDWSGVRVVCDVGGGTGACLAYLLGARPELEGILFDLPEVVAKAPPIERCKVEDGSFFDGVPAGADRYLLLAIVHDWDDEHAATILRNIRVAMAPTARVVVVEGVLPATPRDEFVQATDLLMAVFSTGRERTAAQFDRLFASAGLAVERRVPLVTGFTAHVLAPANA